MEMQDRIRQLMESQHMNQQAFANHTAIATASLSNIYSGRTRPTLLHAVALKKSFPNLNLTWLITGEGDMFETPGSVSSLAPELLSANLQQSEDSTNGGVSGQGDGRMQGTSATDKMAEQLLLQFDDDQLTSQQNTIGQNFRTSSSTNSSAHTPTHSSAHAPTTSSAPSPSRERAMQHGNQNSSPQRQPYPQASIAPVISPVSRKITEIRVFYDDQTWESFVPKK